MCAFATVTVLFPCRHRTFSLFVAVALFQDESVLRDWLGVVGTNYVRAVIKEFNRLPPWLGMSVGDISSVTQSQFEAFYLDRMRDPVFANAVRKVLIPYFEAGVVAVPLTGGFRDWHS